MATLHEVHDASAADVLVAGSYFAGHLAGLGLSEVNIMERLHNAVEDERWKAVISESLDCLEQLWKQVEWESEEVFSNLAEAVRSNCHEWGRRWLEMRFRLLRFATHNSLYCSIKSLTGWLMNYER